MMDEILDRFGDEKIEIGKEETLNYRRVLSATWAIFAICLVARGFELFRIDYELGDRETGLLALIEMYVPEMEFAYQFVIQGFLSFGVALVILYNKRNRKEILLVYLGILGVFYLTGIYFIYLPPPFLALGTLFCVFLIFVSLLKHRDRLFPLNSVELKMEYVIPLSIGFLPFVMEKIIDYKVIHFWDLSWIFN
jgi:hypothetical protein